MDREHVKFEDLDLLRDLGSGCSSIVKLARHKVHHLPCVRSFLPCTPPPSLSPQVTGQYFALKCINLYMKQMRDQLLTELRTLFKVLPVTDRPTLAHLV